jgi:hypothetical protein
LINERRPGRLREKVGAGSLTLRAGCYLFLPLVWPHGIIGHLGETFGSFTASTAPMLEFLSTKSGLSHLAAISTFFRSGGLPPNQTPIGLGPSGGHPIKISTWGPPIGLGPSGGHPIKISTWGPAIGLGSLGGCPAYKLPTCRQGDPLWTLN